MLRILKERYERVYFWPQQHADMEYFQKLSIPGILQINPTLAAYNDFLDRMISTLWGHGCMVVSARCRSSVAR